MHAGTRYIFVGKLFERRPSYHLLGVLLFLQLGISAGSWALHNLTASLSQQQQQQGAPAELERSHPDVGAHTRKALSAAIVLQVCAWLPPVSLQTLQACPEPCSLGRLHQSCVCDCNGSRCRQGPCAHASACLR
jgi:hypothetical protein